MNQHSYASLNNKKDKGIHLCEYETNDLACGLNNLFESEVKIPRIKYGSKQTLDTLISEEALLFAKYLRHGRKEWIPRLANLKPHTVLAMEKLQRKKQNSLAMSE